MAQLTPRDAPCLFSVNGLAAVELAAGDVPALQAFFEENPLYLESVEGRPPGPDEGRGEFESRPPPEFPFTRRWLVAFVDDSRTIIGIADFLADSLAAGVWHIGLFVIATARHGSGDAQRLYAALENWMRSQGAGYLRLGVVRGNARAERFWARMGFVEVRTREGVAMGRRVNTLRVMAKVLGDGSLERYLQLVARDRPDQGGAARR
jgi:GNAT superfamily N-acetyltransferase